MAEALTGSAVQSPSAFRRHRGLMWNQGVLEQADLQRDIRPQMGVPRNTAVTSPSAAIAESRGWATPVMRLAHVDERAFIGAARRTRAMAVSL